MAHPSPLPSGRTARDELAAAVPPPGLLTVDLDALARNYRRLRDLASPAICAAVVKADAYGLGVAPVAARLALEGCTRFFVATVDEGRELRRVVPEASIYVLEGVAAGAEHVVTACGLIPVLNSLEQIERWNRIGGAAVLHIDTGMARLGLDERDIERLAAEPSRLANIEIDHVMTHLACADEPEHPLNAEQLRRFDVLRRRLPPAPTSIGASAGIFLGPEHRGDLVRPGIGLYGGNPFRDRTSPIETVVTLSARVVQIREIAEPVTVGYGATYKARPPCRLAVCGVGYADGYPRAAGNICDAAFRGTRLPVVGRVSMDLTCIDVSALPPSAISVGDYVELIGPTITLDEVANAAGTIGYEILTRLGSRLERRYEGAF